jgi:hypothetical protein
MANIDEDIIKKYFYDVKFGFISADKLHKKLVDAGYDISMTDVQKFYKNQEVNQKTLRKPLKSDRVYNSVIASQYQSNYQIDIIVYDRYEFHKYKYILCVIDVYSRYTSCRALTNRRNETILDAIKNIFAEMGVPQSINADGEFDKKMLNNYFIENDITTYFSQPYEVNKQAIVERFNRTLSGLIQKWRVATQRYDWHNILSDIVNNYNMTYHRTVKTTPYSIKNGEDKNHQVINVVKHDFKINDKVRTIKSKNIFSKGDEVSWSHTIYTVTQIDKNKIYISNDDHQLKRFYKPYELMLIEGAVGVYDKPETEHRVIHKALKKEKKINKVLKQEGVEQENDLGNVKRVRKQFIKYNAK